jgi:hypothetical protein
MKVKWRNILIALGLILAVVLLVDFNRRMEQMDRLTAQLNAVHAEGTAVMETQVALVTQVAYATSDAAVEQWAYTNKWARSGEHPVGLVSGGEATPTPEPPPASQTVSSPNWRIWWEYFFGDQH